MKRIIPAALAAFALAGTAQAQPPIGFTLTTNAPAPQPAAALHGPLPSAATPNAPGEISVPVSFTSPPAQPQQLTAEQLRPIWQQAGQAYGIPWQVLAAINKIESDFGRNMGPSSAGAVGWMQFMPDTWLRWGLDANGDGVADPWNAEDAVYAAARYLAASGGQSDIARAEIGRAHV